MQPVFDVSGAVAALNQTLEYAYPTMTIIGELSQFQISKGKWLYFDIKDSESKLKCFGTIYQLRMPLEDGMMIEVIARPRLHNLYGFSLNVESIRPVGEGSIKKSADLLRAKLEAEGLFAHDRKRRLPYPPEHIALIASGESAAYADFMKIIKARWPLVKIDHYDVQVQGMQAEDDIVRAVRAVNEQAQQPDVVVLIRGGGSADDLSAFSTETVTRAIASSRVPTLVAIGHEIDTSLAELVADVRASTPSNAAELLVPDKKDVAQSIDVKRLSLQQFVLTDIKARKAQLQSFATYFDTQIELYLDRLRSDMEHASLRLQSYHPNQILKLGYSLARYHNGALLKHPSQLQKGDVIELEFLHAKVAATVDNITIKRVKE